MKIEDYNKYYIQGSDHYLIPKDVFDELFNEMENWKEDTQKLEKENKELKECYYNRTDCSGRIKDSKKYDSLKQRIDKAIEEINYWGIDKEHNDNSAMRLALGNILNILNGSDEK